MGCFSHWDSSLSLSLEDCAALGQKERSVEKCMHTCRYVCTLDRQISGLYSSIHLSIYHGKLQNPLNTCCMGVCIYLVGGACSEKGVWWLWVEGVCWTGVSALVVRSNPPHHRCLCWRVQEEGIPVSLQMKRKKERKWVIQGTLIKIKKTPSIHPSIQSACRPSFIPSFTHLIAQQRS